MNSTPPPAASLVNPPRSSRAHCLPPITPKTSDPLSSSVSPSQPSLVKVSLYSISSPLHVAVAIGTEPHITFIILLLYNGGFIVGAPASSVSISFQPPLFSPISFGLISSTNLFPVRMDAPDCNGSHVLPPLNFHCISSLAVLG